MQELSARSQISSFLQTAKEITIIQEDVMEEFAEHVDDDDDEEDDLDEVDRYIVTKLSFLKDDTVFEW